MVTIRRYSDPHAAQSAKAFLESEGFLVYLKNENFASIVPGHGTVLTEVELQVEADEAESALQLVGPVSGNHAEVARISGRLNRVFMLSGLCAILVMFIHLASEGFAMAELSNSISLGVITGFLSLFAQGMIKSMRGKE